MLSTRGVQRPAEDAGGAARPTSSSCWPPPIRRRCSHHPEPHPALRVPPARARDVLGELLDQVNERGRTSRCADEAIDLAVRRGHGSARDALSVLDQVAASDSVEDDLPELDEVVEALAERDVGRALVAVAHLASAGFSPQQLAADLVDYLRQGFLALVAPDLVAVSRRPSAMRSASQAERVGLAALVRAMEVLGRAQVDMRDAARPPGQSRSGPGAAGPPRSRRLARGAAGPHRAPRSRPRRSPAVSVTRATAPRRSESASDRRRLPEPGPGSGPPRAVGRIRRHVPAGPALRQPAEETRPAPAQPAPTQPAPASAAQRDPAPGRRRWRSRGRFPTRDQLVQAWGDHVLGRLRPKAKALFQAGRFVAVDGDRPSSGYPTRSTGTAAKRCGARSKPRSSEQFGRPVALELVVDPGRTADCHRAPGRCHRRPAVLRAHRSSGSPSTPAPAQRRSVEDRAERDSRTWPPSTSRRRARSPRSTTRPSPA